MNYVHGTSHLLIKMDPVAAKLGAERHIMQKVKKRIRQPRRCVSVERFGTESGRVRGRISDPRLKSVSAADLERPRGSKDVFATFKDAPSVGSRLGPNSTKAS